MVATGVLIIGEVVEGGLLPITRELLGAGRRLADELSEGLSTLLIGASMGDASKEAIAFGADKVYMADDPLFSSYDTDCYTEVATRVCQELAPSILLLGQTDTGRDLAPRLASRLKTGLCMDCVELTIDPDTKLMLQTRPVYGGNALATMVCRSTQPQMATVRPKSMAPSERDDSHQGEVTPWKEVVDTSVMKTKLVDRVKEEEKGIKIEDAEVVVGGGRGIGSAENFSIISELAKLLGGAVGGTRPAYEEGWIPASVQIGMTGKIIGPKIYFAVALSGAMQHIAGCTGAKNIIAINKDAEANIFKVAHFGIVGDFKEVVPKLTEELKGLLAA